MRCPAACLSSLSFTSVRGFLFGLVVLAGISLSILSLRPGGIRQQLRLVARRFRIVLILGGIWIFGSLILRLAFPTGPVSEYGSPALAIGVAVVFFFVGRDPVTATESNHRGRVR